MAHAIVPAAKTGRVRGDRPLFTSSDDNAMMKPILASHAPDGREFDVQPLLHIIEDIMQRSNPAIAANSHGAEVHLDALEEKAHENDFADVLELVALTINKISCEILCKCSGGGDAHANTVALFNALSGYTWDGKVVIILAAFAVNYGEFWLVAHLYLTNPLAKSIALLKQLPEILERTEAMKPKFEAVTNLIKAMLDVTKCIVKFKELPPQYITPDTPEMAAATAHIPIAAYWTIRSIVACATVLLNIIGMGHEYITSTTEAWELSSLAHKVNNINGHLNKQLALCQQYIDEKKHIEAFQTLVRLFETPHMDNMKILRALIYAKDDQSPLFDGSTKRAVGLDVLRRKNVLLLISDLDIIHQDFFILEQIYSESKEQPTRMESQYEIVWLPVVNRSVPWNEEREKQFENLRSEMIWHSVHHPRMIDPAVIKYVKEVWNFDKKPILVALDPQGKMVNPNAIHMIYIWGSLAFPFTSFREEALWKMEETWKIELLADNLEPLIFQWIAEGKYICLYGGEDMEWIRRFTTTLKGIAEEAQILLEMLYFGKSNAKDKVRRNTEVIIREKLSRVLLPDIHIWFFWVRLESMWHSKMKHGRTVENDPIMQEIMTMLSFDGSDMGWAVIIRGSAEMAKAKGDTIMNSLTEFQSWKDQVPEKGFVGAINDHLLGLHTPHHCNRLILPGTTGKIPERVVCAECGRPMEKFIMYRCCND